MKRILFYDAVQLCNDVSDNDLVCSSDVKKFIKNYFDLIMCKFTPGGLKFDRIF